MYHDSLLGSLGVHRLTSLRNGPGRGYVFFLVDKYTLRLSIYSNSEAAIVDAVFKHNLPIYVFFISEEDWIVCPFALR